MTRMSDPYENIDLDEGPICGKPSPRCTRDRHLWWKIPLCFIRIPYLTIREHFYTPRPTPTPQFAEYKERCKGSEAPEPLPSLRRALTLPGGVVSGSGSGPGSAQQLSLFFSKLPLDIRYLIYKYVMYFSGSACRLHVVNLHRRLRSVSCYVNPDPIEYENRMPTFQVVHSWQHCCWGHEASDGTSVLSPNIVYPRRNLTRVRGLLCSCRRVYSEAIDLLYTSNPFNVRLTRTILDMQKCIPPQRLRLIRSLELDVPLHVLWGDDRVQESDPSWPANILIFWDPAWSVIAEMHGLLKLTISISSRAFGQPVIDRETLTHVLKPMMAVKHVRDFALEVCLPLPGGLLEDVLRELGGDPPFSVEVKEFRYLRDLYDEYRDEYRRMRAQRAAEEGLDA